MGVEEQSEEFREVEHAWRNPPGSVDSVGRAVAIVGVTVSLLILAVIIDMTATSISGKNTAGFIRFLYQLPTLGIVGLLIHWREHKGPVAKSLQALVCIPFFHLFLLCIAAGLWAYVTSQTPYLREQISLLDQLPVERYALVSAALFALMLAWHAHRNPGAHQRLLQPLGSTLLLYTLVLGLWLPVVSYFSNPCTFSTSGVQYFYSPEHGLEPVRCIMRTSFVWTAAVPPAILAILLGCAAHLPWLRRQQGTIFKLTAAAALASSLVVTLVANAYATISDIEVYANLLPLLLWAALMSMIAITALSWGHWQSLRHSRDSAGPADGVQEGVVVSCDDTEEVGYLVYRGWYSGLRAQANQFLLRTDTGDLLVPKGARLITEVPLWTSRANPGESRAVLRVGDRVRATGFVSSQKGGPFRGSEMPIAGTKGLTVSKLGFHNPWQSLALIGWRPALLYTLVIVLVALPGIALFFKI